MKAMIFTLAMILTLSSSAQTMRTLFYGSSINSIPAFTDSIKAALPAFRLDSSFTSKSGKSETLIFKDASGSSIEASLLTFDGKINTVRLIGPHEALLALYDRYLASLPASSDNCAPILLAKLETGQIMPVSFCKNSTGERWTLANKMPL